MLEKDPRFGESSPSNLEAYREARRDAARDEQPSDAQIEKELAELDDAISGWDAAQMKALRVWASEADTQNEETSGVVRKPR